MIPKRYLGPARRAVAAFGATVGAWGLFSHPTGRGTHLGLGIVLLASAVLPFSRRLEAQIVARALWLQVLLVSVLRALTGPSRDLGPAVATSVVLCASLGVLGLDRLTADERSPALRLPRFRFSTVTAALLAAMQAVSCAWVGALQLEHFRTVNLALPLAALSGIAALALLRARTVGLALSAVASGSVAVLAGSSLLASPRLSYAMYFGLAVAQLVVLTPLWRAVHRYLSREEDEPASVDEVAWATQLAPRLTPKHERLATAVSFDLAPALEDLERPAGRPVEQTGRAHS
jgi:hypothetical protein